MPCAASRSSRATRSARSTRSARPAARSAELDLLLEHDLALERPVHRALRGDLHEPLALIFGQLLWEAQRQVELRGRAALRRLVVDLALHVADVPALAHRVHLDGDRDARGEAHSEHLLRIWSRVVAALVLRLVDRERVVADHDPVLVAPVLPPGDRFS